MVYVMLAEGFEETEALAPIDILRRGGVEVQTVGVTGMQVKSSHGVTVLADCKPEDCDPNKADMVFLPGGMPGTKNLFQSEFVRKIVQFCADNDRYVTAICAAPSIVLGGMGLLHGKRATCFPGMEDGMTGAIPQDRAVVVDGKFITGRAAGAVLEFALVLCEKLAGKSIAQEVGHSIHYANA